MIRLTHIGKLFLVVMAGLYCASITSQSGLLLLLVGMITACFALNMIQAWSALRHLEITPSHSLSLPEGSGTTDPWIIWNLGGTTAGLIEVAISNETFIRVSQVLPGQKIYAVPSLATRKRGVYSFENISVGSSMPFGLLTCWRNIHFQGAWIVYPKLHLAPSPPAAGYDLMVGGKHKGSRRTTSGTHFAGVRPMTSGDPLKQIHWKASAKGLGLMVKTYDEELSGRIGFIVDVGQSGDDDALDDCLRTAGSLMFAGLDDGHHIEWIDPVSQELKIVPPFDEGNEILEALAGIKTTPGCLSDANLHAALEKLSKRGSVVLVLTAYNAAVEKLVHHLISTHRTVSVYLPESVSPSPPVECHIVHYGKHSILP